MAVLKEKKVKILKDLKEVAQNSGSIVFINFHGLGVNDTTLVRKALREKGVHYMVAKKTLTRKALSEAGIKGDMPTLDGELGLVYGKDLIEPAREIYTFQKKLDKKLSILGGVFEGRFMNQGEMVTVAQIPSQKTLHAMVVNLINSPIAGFVRALDQIAMKKA